MELKFKIYKILMGKSGRRFDAFEVAEELKIEPKHAQFALMRLAKLYQNIYCRRGLNGIVFWHEVEE